MARNPEIIAGWRRAEWTSRCAWRCGLLNSGNWKQSWARRMKQSQASWPDVRERGCKSLCFCICSVVSFLLSFFLWLEALWVSFVTWWVSEWTVWTEHLYGLLLKG
jgi:hypothetical protein